MTTDNTITTIEQLEALPLGQWIIDADGAGWALFDTNMGGRQRMWRDQKGKFFVAHSEVKLPALLVVPEFETPCEHAKLNFEGWQCNRCAAVINEPPPAPEPPEPVEPERGRAWFYMDSFGEWCGMSPDFDNIIALAEDLHTRPHDNAARDRYEFEIAALSRIFAELSADDLKDGGDGSDGIHLGLSLIISHLVNRKGGAA
jgi:hypothetical protein